MATKEFKQQLIETAVDLGTVIEVGDEYISTTTDAQGKTSDAFTSTSNFNDSLKAQWMTTEVLTKTLAKYANAEEDIGKRAYAAATEVKTFSQMVDTIKEAVGSTWAQTFELIFGNLKEAKQLWTALGEELTKIFVGPAEALKNILADWVKFGGNAFIFEGIANIWARIKELVGAVGDAWRQVFPPATGKQLADISKKFRDFTAGLKFSETTLMRVQSIFKGFFAILDIGKQVISAVFSVFSPLIGRIFGVGEALLPVASNIGNVLSSFDTWLKKNDVIKNSLQSLVNVITSVFKKIDEAFKSITGSSIVDTLMAFRDKILALTMDISLMFLNMGSGEATSGLGSFVESVKRFLEPLGSLFAGFRSIISGLWAGLKNLGPVFSALAKGLGDALKAIGDGLKNAISGADTSKLVDLANGGVLLGIAGMIKKFLDSFKKNKESGGGIIAKIKEIKDALIDFSDSLQKSVKVAMLIEIAIAIGILSAALVALASIDSDKLAGALAAMTAEFAELVAFMTILDKKLGKDGGSRINKVAIGMIAMSLSVSILSSAMKKLAGLEWDDVLKGLLTITVLCSTLTRTAKNLSKDSETMMKGATGLIAFAIAVRLLVKPVRDLGSLDIPTLVKGLVSLGALFAELGVFMKAADFSGFGVSTGLGMIGLAAAMILLGKALAQIGSLDIPTLAKGLVAMGVALAEIAIAVKFLPTNLPIIATGMVLMGTALLLIGNALKTMGSMDWGGVAKGLIALGGALAEIVIAMKFMTGALPGAAALLVVAASLAVLAPILRAFGEMSLGEIVKALLMLGGAFAVIGVAGALIAPVVPALLGFAGAVALLGVGAMAAGAGVALLGAGLAALAAGGVAAIELLKVAVLTLLTIIPNVAASVGRAILEVIAVIGNGAPIITGAVKNILLSVLTMINDIKGELITTVVGLVENILRAIADNAPSILDSVIRIIIALLTAVRDNIGPMIDIVIDTLLAILAGITAKIPDFIQAGIDIIIGLIDGLAMGIEKNTPRIKQAIINLFKALINAAKEILGIHSPSTVFSTIGKNMILGAIEGISSMIGRIKSAISEVIHGAIDKAREFVGSFASIGGDLINGLASGIRNGVSGAINAVSSLASSVIGQARSLFQINSPSKIFAWMGEMNVLGLANGMLDNSDISDSAAEQTVNSAINAMGEALAKANDLVTNDFDINPTIAPVLDLTNVEDGVGQIDGMLNKQRLITSGVGLAAQSSANSQILSALNGMSPGGNTANFNIYVTGGQNADATEIANEVMRRINIEYQRQKAVWG